MRDVWVSETDLGGGLRLYTVFVDGAKYDEMFLRSGPPLTFSQMDDIAAGYREGLGSG